MGKSILATFAGFMAAGIIPVVGDALVRALAPGAFPDAGHPATVWLLVAFAYTFLAGAAAGAVGALIDPRPRVSWALSVLVLGVGVLAWASRPDSAPLWWHLAVLASVVPAVFLGARSVAGRR